MTRYTVALVRYLADDLPAAADRLFRRAERNVDRLETPAITVGEAVWTAVNKGAVGSETPAPTPKRVLCGLVEEGPVELVQTHTQTLTVYGSLVDHHTMHDASHRARETKAIVTNDDAFPTDRTVWE